MAITDPNPQDPQKPTLKTVSATTLSAFDEQLKEAILKENLLPEKNLQNLIATIEGKQISLEDLIFERGLIPEEKLATLISTLYDTPLVKLSDKVIPDPLIRIIPYTLASKQSVIPFDRTASTLKIAFNNPKNYELINFLEKKTGLEVEPFYSTKRDIKAALKAYNRDVNEKFTQLLKGVLQDPTKIESLKDAAKILDTIILFAYQNNTSDIHIEPHKTFFTVRYRVDGILQTIAELPIEILELLTTRIKVLSNLRTDEHRAAQDGRFKIDLENNEITLRVSIVPTYDGEKTVMRILNTSNQDLTLESLGYSERNLKVIHNNILKTNGILLITGPTGSGKTTTLYSVLKLLNSPEVNIATIEDPVEYRLEGINQIQVNPKTNLTFANGLRSLLRQDPDIIMVGEIRDEETAGIAINAALTGHLVLATLHTNDAASTLPRLVDMGIEAFLVSATIKMIVAQRLVRKICSKCKKSYEISWDQIKSLDEKFNLNEILSKTFTSLKQDPTKNITLYKGEGCSTCGGTGFKGRNSISEVIDVSDDIRKLILKNASPTEIQDTAVKEGMEIMFTDGMKKALDGTTTIEEILRVMRS